MSLRALANAKVLCADGFRDGHAVVLDGTRIESIIANDALPPGTPSEERGGKRAT